MENHTSIANDSTHLHPCVDDNEREFISQLLIAFMSTRYNASIVTGNQSTFMESLADFLSSNNNLPDFIIRASDSDFDKQLSALVAFALNRLFREMREKREICWLLPEYFASRCSDSNNIQLDIYELIPLWINNHLKRVVDLDSDLQDTYFELVNLLYSRRPDNTDISDSTSNTSDTDTNSMDFINACKRKGLLVGLVDTSIFQLNSSIISKRDLNAILFADLLLTRPGLSQLPEERKYSQMLSNFLMIKSTIDQLHSQYSQDQKRTASERQQLCNSIRALQQQLDRTEQNCVQLELKKITCERKIHNLTDLNADVQWQLQRSIDLLETFMSRKRQLFDHCHIHTISAFDNNGRRVVIEIPAPHFHNKNAFLSFEDLTRPLTADNTNHEGDDNEENINNNTCESRRSLSAPPNVECLPVSVNDCCNEYCTNNTCTDIPFSPPPSPPLPDSPQSLLIEHHGLLNGAPNSDSGDDQSCLISDSEFLFSLVKRLLEE